MSSPHQWFGDLVTPAWWDDIWLNESFANWMGYRIGNEWRPDLKINVGAIDEAFRAMNTDALKAGRPIHQPIKTSGEIDSAFDAVTYGKGGQVVAMIAAYLGDEKFRDGVRLHLNRHAYGNASTEQFFAALAEAAHDPRVLTALKSFVDQQGVPVVRVERTAGGLAVSQKRYAMLGTDIAPETWTIPLCIRIGETRQCSLLDKTSATLPDQRRRGDHAQRRGHRLLPLLTARNRVAHADRPGRQPAAGRGAGDDRQPVGGLSRRRSLARAAGRCGQGDGGEPLFGRRGGWRAAPRRAARARAGRDRAICPPIAR